jgi:hypothetical protein
LAQFWNLRLEPLVRSLKNRDAIFRGRFFEAIGWLNEGVFCGFFDSHEADIVWVRLNAIAASCGAPSPQLVGEPLLTEIRKLYRSKEPFRASLQMQEGTQKKLELPLFPYALLVSNRLSADPLAGMFTYSIQSLDDKEWNKWESGCEAIDHRILAERLGAPHQASLDAPSLLAGYLRVLEHLAASQSFFRQAKSRSPRSSDFESFCQRIGGLTAWRLPLYDQRTARRFEKMQDLSEFAMRPLLKEQFPDVEWSVWQGSFSRHVASVVSDWETHHLSAQIQLA